MICKLKPARQLPQLGLSAGALICQTGSLKPKHPDDPVAIARQLAPTLVSRRVTMMKLAGAVNGHRAKARLI
jgi:hypothetical protein